MINFIIATHGEFGAYLVEAAEEIVGRQAEGVRTVPISSRLSMAEVRGRVERAVRELRSEDGLIVATDMPGGTPSNIVLPMVKDMPKVAVVSGLNLYMLVSAFSHRASLSFEELSQRMLADGRKSIQDMKAMLQARAQKIR